MYGYIQAYTTEVAEEGRVHLVCIAGSWQRRVSASEWGTFIYKSR